MPKLRVFESISIDGYFTDTDGDMSWAHAGPPDAKFDAWVAQNASGGGALLFGRVTYEMMASFWPTPAAAKQMPAVARGMNAAPKYVASRTLKPTWENTKLLKGKLVDAVRKLKASRLKGLTVLGSGDLAAQLGEAGLVDEYQFVIVPIALGAGRTVFRKHRELKLIEQRAFPSGKVVVTYAT